MSEPQRLSWFSLLEHLTADVDRPTSERTGSFDAENLWSEVARRVRLLAAMSRLTRFGLESSDVDDIIQSVLTKLQTIEGLKSVRDARSPQAYLLSALRNAAIDCSRRSRREVATDESDVRAVRINVELDLAVREVLRALTPEERRLIELRFFEGRTLTEIAKSMGMSYSAAGTRLFRLLARLRAELATLKGRTM